VPARIGVEPTAEGARLTVRRGGRTAEEILPIAAATGAEIETVTLAGGSAVAVVRITRGASGAGSSGTGSGGAGSGGAGSSGTGSSGTGSSGTGSSGAGSGGAASGAASGGSASNGDAGQEPGSGARRQYRVAAVVTVRGGAPVVLWTGTLTPRGDPGDRRADVLQVADRTGDGVPEVIVAETAGAQRICGQARTLLAPRAVDPRTLELRPVILRRLPREPDAGQVTLEASRESPGPTGPPLLDVLSFTTASSSAGVGADPSLVPPPQALGDEDDATVWMEGHGGPGRWEYASARFSGGDRRIAAFAITPSPADPELAVKLGRPKSLWVVGDTGARLRVEFPSDPVDTPGARWWIVPPEPLPWSCVSIVLDEAYLPEGEPPATTRTALAEVAAYTRLDFGAGIEELAREVAGGGPAAAEAARLLRDLGLPATRALAERWPRMSDRGRRRALRVFATHARAHGEARAALVRAAAEGEPAALREAAIDALADAGEPAATALTRLAKEPGRAGDRAAKGLATLPPLIALPHLLAATAAPGGEARPRLRRAIGRSIRGASAGDVEAAVQTWADRTRTGAVAAAALGLASAPEGRAAARSLLAAHHARADTFPDRYRFMGAARRLRSSAETPADATIDRWLAAQAGSAEPWMLRATAVATLAARGSGAAVGTARAALADEYPRVRKAAVEALAGRNEDAEALALRTRRDPWPIVRAAGARALIRVPRARPVLRAAILDPARRVRAAAIEALTEVRDEGAWERVRARLADDKEWPEVLNAGVKYVIATCPAGAVEPLEAIVDRALEPRPWAPDVEVAMGALGALSALGTERARQILARVATEAPSAALRAAAVRARREPLQCGTRSTGEAEAGPPAVSSRAGRRRPAHGRRSRRMRNGFEAPASSATASSATASSATASSATARSATTRSANR
jgi:HEAT repeat protein